MEGEAQQPGRRGSLVRVPGALVVGAWVLLFLAGFVVAGLVNAAGDRKDAVRLARLRAELRIEPQPFELDNLLGHEPQAAGSESPDPYLDAARAAIARLELEEAVQAANRMRVGAVVGALVWILGFGLVTVGTGRWLTGNRGWVRVRSWHGGKLLILYLTFITAASVFVVAAASASVVRPADITLLVTGTLLLLVGGAMLVRTTWNWLTGRETQAGADPERAGLEAGSRSNRGISLLWGSLGQARSWLRGSRMAWGLWLAVGLLLGAIAGYLIARQPRTYADCVLRGMKHATTATATRALTYACSRKFGAVARPRSAIPGPWRAQPARGPQPPQPPQPPRGPRPPQPPQPPRPLR